MAEQNENTLCGLGAWHILCAVKVNAALQEHSLYKTYKKHMTVFWEEKLKNGRVRVVKIMSDENVEAFMAAPEPKELLRTHTSVVQAPLRSRRSGGERKAAVGACAYRGKLPDRCSGGKHRGEFEGGGGACGGG